MRLNLLEMTRVCWLAGALGACRGEPAPAAADAAALADAGSDGSDTAVADSAADSAAGDVAGDVAGDTAAVRVDFSWPPDLPGPYRVGYRTAPLTYVPAADGVTRTIQLSVWYPTEATTGTPAVYYAALPIPHDDVFADAPLAPPADASGYPVHEFTHGHLGFGGSAPYMVRHFASHGWVVIAADHTGNTLENQSDPQRPPQIYWWREADDKACLDWLEHLPGSDPLAGKVRTDKVFLTGHSFGGTDTWALAGAGYNTQMIAANCAAGHTDVDCSLQAQALYKAGFRDPRVAAAVSLAGGAEGNVFTLDALTAVTIPMMIMTGSDDPGHPGGPQWDHMAHGVWVDIAGACHQTFGLGDCPGATGAAIGPPIVWTYTLAMARMAVLGDTGPLVGELMDGSRTPSKLVTFKRK